MRRLKSIASGRSSVSDPVRAPFPGPFPTAIGGPGTRIGCLMTLYANVRVHFVLIRSVVSCGSVCSFHLLAWLWLPTLQRLKRCTACCLLRWQALYFALANLAFGSLRFKVDILFVFAEVFISPVGLIDVILAVMR